MSSTAGGRRAARSSAGRPIGACAGTAGRILQAARPCAIMCGMRTSIARNAIAGGAAAVCFSLCGCAEPPPPSEPEFTAIVVSGDTKLPDWYKVLFTLRHLDGRVYEGECIWPDSYTPVLLQDSAKASQSVKPGKTWTTIREIEGAGADKFIPNGRGVMRYPNGAVKSGSWRNGQYTGGL